MSLDNFKIRKYIRSQKDEGVNDYIEELENYILAIKASNTNQLIFKLDEMNGTIIEDLDKIMNGEAVEEYEYEYYNKDEGEYETKTGYRSTLKVLNDDKESKVFDRVMTLYGKIKDLKVVSELVAKMIPEVEEEESITNKIKVTKGGNVFESISEQVGGRK